MLKTAYRPEIDGLRALSIGCVILFHLHSPWLRGGFIGVDVFFVISGFLITGIMDRELTEKTFSLSAFYARRIRRIIPALLAVVAATIVAQYCIGFRLDCSFVGKQALAALGSISNIFFWRQSADYWGVKAEHSPLLHTWSLAIEEQFYFVLPFGLMLLHNRSLLCRALTIALTISVSLVALWWTSSEASLAGFYLLPTRWWELSVGSLLALVIRARPQQPRHPAWVGVLGIMGLVLILSSAYFLRRLDLTMSWPVVGAVLVLACGHSGPCHWLLTRPPLVHLGKLSYSLYLWHWPILVFAEPYCNEWSKGWLIVPIYLCAWLSFHGIEQTTRWRSGIVPSILATAGVLGIAGALLTFAGRAYDTSRFDEPSSSALSFDLNPDRISSSSHRRNLPNFYIGFKTFPSLASLTAYREDGIVLGDESKPIQVMVIGDSHGLMWSQTVRQIVERHHLRASFCSIGGVAPPWNLHPTSRQSRILSGNMRFEFDRRRLENLARWRPDVVILSTPWDRQTEQNVAALIGYCQEHSRRVLLLEQPPRLAEIGDRNALQYACFRGLVPQPGQKQFWPVMDRAPRGFHQLLDRVLLRSSETPIEKWHCCSLWQRSLLNKWNSREFAKLCGVPVPELYWSGRWASKLPLDQMPEYFVIRPAWGAGSKGTYVVSGTKNLINNECYPDRPALKQAVLREHGQWQLFPLLAEEFLLNQHGEPESGIEFKFLMFGQHVGAIMTFRRVGDKKFVRYYTDQWEPIEQPFHFSVGLDEVISCPDNFTEMKEIATRLATAFGTFVRVDLYNTSKGIYFGEFSSVPGGGGRYTDFANEFLGRAWQTYMPDMI